MNTYDVLIISCKHIGAGAGGGVFKSKRRKDINFLPTSYCNLPCSGMTLHSICLSVTQPRSSGELCVCGLKDKPKQPLGVSICNIRIWKLDRWGWCPQKPAAWNHASTRSTAFWGRVNQCLLESTPLMVLVSWPPGTTHGRVGWDIISIVNSID